ncbi:MAG: site-specific DNA-methyltransferase [Deltaproteobacteria bacterium]|nr:site-specific DNA-methyltransferase [Deltaproteobacteria bacterium]
MSTKKTAGKKIKTIKHTGDKRKNIPTIEHQPVVQKEHQTPIQVAYERRNPDLDPQLVWRGKDLTDWSDLVVNAPPLYIQEKVHPKVLIDDLQRRSQEADAKQSGHQVDMFADFNGIPEGVDKTEFYQHDQNWSNRMILGDSLQVMASLAEREGLRGKVQCIYIDPPYGIKFNSNFQWSTTSRDVKDGKMDHITREPEQVKAFRDTWRDGIHSYLTYLRERITVARDLLNESGSIFIQIGDENLHRVKVLMDEIFGAENIVSSIICQKTGGQRTLNISNVADFILWYAKSSDRLKYRNVFHEKGEEWATKNGYKQYFEFNSSSSVEINEWQSTSRSKYQATSLTSQNPGAKFLVQFHGDNYVPTATQWWKTDADRFQRLIAAARITRSGSSLRYVRYIDDFPVYPINNIWVDTGVAGFASDKRYVVETNAKIIERCILMATDPGDLVFDPTCGSGTTAYVAEQWGRRWITIDTSRVALALARSRIMGARYPYYLLADSKEGLEKERELTGKAEFGASRATYGDIRHGFVYERVPHITLKSIANNAEIDVIWEKWQKTLEPLREALNKALKQKWEEWEIPREAEDGWPKDAKAAHAEWWKARIARQKEIDESIARQADYEYLYDKPYEDKKTVRVAGPFTVESLSPHRILGVDDNDELIDPQDKLSGADAERQSFAQMVLENLRTAGVQQAHKDDKINFVSLEGWPGELVCAEGRYFEGGEESGQQKRAAIFIGPEFGTVTRPDLAQAAREAAEAGFDVLITCAFNYDAHSTDFAKLGRLPVLKARMNADLHMADDLKNTGKGNLFVIFGEPDIDVITLDDGQVQVKLLGIDVFKPNTGEVVSNEPDEIALWFIDTDYNEESFFVRHAYFLGANDPYKALKTTLKAQIDEEAWASLHSDTSRPFDKPASGRIAVKVINHLGDEVMKVFRVE